MQKVSKGIKLIGVHPEAYGTLRDIGRVTDSFADVVDKVLEVYVGAKRLENKK